jgi:hypothetical protein
MNGPRSLAPSDLPFSTRIEARNARLRFVLANRSAIDPGLPLRLLVYVTLVLERARCGLTGEKVPALTSVGVSHALGRWAVPRNLHTLFEPNPRQAPDLAALVPGLRWSTRILR